MTARNIHTICFSPTGGTLAVVERIADTLAARLNYQKQSFNYTLAPSREMLPAIAPDDIVVWGTPVYAGRIPNKTLDFVKAALKGNGNPTILVATFGGRNFDDCLAEMQAIAINGGLRPVAAAAVVCRHVFSKSLAAGRPDNDDLLEIAHFAELVDIDRECTPSLPGSPHPSAYYTPLKSDGTPALFLKAKPSVDTSRCTLCGRCSTVCPTDCIKLTPDDAHHDDSLPHFSLQFPGICIKCHACILNCPQQALAIDHPDFLSHVEMLESNFSSPSRNQFFL